MGYFRRRRRLRLLRLPTQWTRMTSPATTRWTWWCRQTQGVSAEERHRWAHSTNVFLSTFSYTDSKPIPIAAFARPLCDVQKATPWKWHIIWIVKGLLSPHHWGTGCMTTLQNFSYKILIDFVMTAPVISVPGKARAARYHDESQHRWRHFGTHTRSGSAGQTNLLQVKQVEVPHVPLSRGENQVGRLRRNYQTWRLDRHVFGSGKVTLY